MSKVSYVMERVVENCSDSPWSRMYENCKLMIRPVDLSPSQLRKYLDREKSGTVMYQAVCCSQQKDETEEAYLMRAAINGFGPDFEDQVKVLADGTTRVIKTIDIETGKEYLYGLA